MNRAKYLEDIVHCANSQIGLARLALKNGDPTSALKVLDAYCEQTDRLEVRHLGVDRAAQLLGSGIIHPTPAFADEIEKMRLAGSMVPSGPTYKGRLFYGGQEPQ